MDLDGAFTVMTMHHVKDVARAVSAISSHLRSGAKFVMIDFEKSDHSERFHPLKAHPSVAHHGFEKSEFEVALKSAGLTQITVSRAFEITKPVEGGGEMQFGFLAAVAVKP